MAYDDSGFIIWKIFQVLTTLWYRGLKVFLFWPHGETDDPVISTKTDNGRQKTAELGRTRILELQYSAFGVRYSSSLPD